MFSANLDETGRGFEWGTWKVVADSGAEWEGTFEGTEDSWFGAATGNIVGRGTVGAAEGMQLRFVYSYEHFPIDLATGNPGVETISGFRIETNAKK